MKNLTLGLGLDESPPFMMMMGRYNPSISYKFIDINAVDTMETDNYIVNSASATTSGNLFSFPSGIVPNSAGSKNASINPFYAIGVKGEQTASRVQISSTGSNSYLGVSDGVVKAGTYTYSVKLKSNVGAGVQTVSFGNYSKGLSQVTITEDSFVKFSNTFTYSSDGTSWFMFLATENVDFLVDEIQLYEGSSTPDYEVSLDTHIGSVTRTNNTFNKVGDALVFSEGLGGGLNIDSSPLKKDITEMTLMAVYKTSNISQIAGKIVSSDGGEGVYDIGINYGVAYGKPASPRGSTIGLNTADTGYHIIASRFKNGEQAFFFDGIKYDWNNNTLSLNKAQLGFCGDVMDGGYPFLGNITNVLGFNKWLSDAEMATEFSKLKTRHNATTETPIQDSFNFWIAEGDSITTNGTSYNYFKQYFDNRVNQSFGRNIATYGARLTDANLRLPDLILQIEQLVSLGHTPIVSVFFGANDLFYSSVSEVFASLQTYWLAVRNAGAKVVACTILPRSYNVDAVQWDMDRSTLNTNIRNASAEYDALIDFGGSPTIGADAEASNTTYFNDGLHPNEAGHNELYAIAKPIIDNLVV